MTSLQIIGVPQTRANMKRLATTYGAAFHKEYAEMPKQVKAKADDLIPVDTGAAKTSGRIFKDEGDTVLAYGGLEIETPRGTKDTSKYVIRLHEDLDMNHPRGGQAKFLEQPYLEMLPGLEQRIATRMRAIK